MGSLVQSGASVSPSQAIVFGAEGTAATFVDATHPLPVAVISGGGGGGVSLSDTIWTDDTNAYFVRRDSGTAITWTDISGTASSAPGTGARPASGLTAVIDRASYAANSGGTGFSTGDLIDHIVISDPGSGVVIGNFWINSTTSAKITAPSAGALSAITLPVTVAALPLPAGAATQATLASILTGVNAATPAGENFIGQVGGPMLFPSASFTTTALTTAWSANQLIADNATAGSVTVLTFANAVRVTGGTASIRRARAKVAADTGFAGQSVILKLYRDAPTLSAGDRATWLTTEASFIGQLSITLDQHFSDFEKGIGSPSVGNEINFAASGGTTIYGLLVSSGTITPQAGSKAITVTLEILSN